MALENVLAVEFLPFLFTLSFFFFLLRSGHMPGRQQGWRICVKEGKMKRTLRITSQGPVFENLMCF